MPHLLSEREETCQSSTHVTWQESLSPRPLCTSLQLCKACWSSASHWVFHRRLNRVQPRYLSISPSILHHMARPGSLPYVAMMNVTHAHLHGQALIDRDPKRSSLYPWDLLSDCTLLAWFKINTRQHSTNPQLRPVRLLTSVLLPNNLWKRAGPKRARFSARLPLHRGPASCDLMPKVSINDSITLFSLTSRKRKAREHSHNPEFWQTSAP